MLEQNLQQNLKKKNSNEELCDASLRFCHKLMITNELKSIIDKLKLPRMGRNAKIGLKHYPKNKKFKCNFINNISEVY